MQSPPEPRCLIFWPAIVLAATVLLSLDSHAEPLPVIVAPVKSTLFTDRIEALGTLYANETALLSSTITETIAEIHFDDGQRVQRGDVLVVMTNHEQQAELAEARAAVAEAEQQFNRSEELSRRGAESVAMLDLRRREIDVAEARLKGAEARMADRIIKAPFAGVLGLRQVSVGSLLAPGDRIATLHDDSVMKLDFTVPEILLASVAPGTSIEAHSRIYPDMVFEGRVESIDNQVDPVTRAITVRALLPNPDNLLRPGFLMQVTLLASPRETLVIPEAALMPFGRENYVYVIRDSESNGLVAERQTIEIGNRRRGEVEILSGLRAGEQVVTHGNIRLSPGQAVRIRAEDHGDLSLPDILSRDNAN